jgi:hypothetical protein
MSYRTRFFIRYPPKNIYIFEIKLYRFVADDIHDMTVYLEKQRGNIAEDVKYSRTLSNKKRGGFGHRLFKHNYF